MNARYYDPVVGRFLTEDPAQQHTSWYSYCGNNPLNHTDPDGRRESAEIQKITSTVEKNMKSGNFLGFSGKGYGSFAPALVDGFLAHTGDWYNTKGLFPSDRDTDKKGWNQLSPHDIDTNCAMEFRAKGLLKLGQDLMRHDTRSITVYSGTPDKADMWKAGQVELGRFLYATNNVLLAAKYEDPYRFDIIRLPGPAKNPGVVSFTFTAQNMENMIFSGQLHISRGGWDGGQWSTEYKSWNNSHELATVDFRSEYPFQPGYQLIFEGSGAIYVLNHESSRNKIVYPLPQHSDEIKNYINNRRMN
jgi:hypothetical protein